MPEQGPEGMEKYLSDADKAKLEKGESESRESDGEKLNLALALLMSVLATSHSVWKNVGMSDLRTRTIMLTQLALIATNADAIKFVANEFIHGPASAPDSEYAINDPEMPSSNTEEAGFIINDNGAEFQSETVMLPSAERHPEAGEESVESGSPSDFGLDYPEMIMSNESDPEYETGEGSANESTISPPNVFLNEGMDSPSKDFDFSNSNLSHAGSSESINMPNARESSASMEGEQDDPLIWMDETPK